jgi:hypothetical protein
MIKHFILLLSLGFLLGQEIVKSNSSIHTSKQGEKKAKSEKSISKDIEIETDEGDIIILHPDRTWEYKEIDIHDMGRDVLELQNGAVYLGVYKSKTDKLITFHVDESPTAQSLPFSMIKSLTLSDGYIIYKSESNENFKEKLKNEKTVPKKNNFTKKTLTYKNTINREIVKSIKGGSEFDTYKAKNGMEINIGDTLIIGEPSSLTTQTGLTGTETVFSFILMGSLGLSQFSIFAGGGQSLNIPASSRGDKIIIEKIFVNKYKSKKASEIPIVINTRMSNMEKTKIMTAGSQRTITNIEKALSMGEIILKNAPLTRQQAIEKLKEAKELLELDIILQSEYDALKKELTPIIRK